MINGVLIKQKSISPLSQPYYRMLDKNGEDLSNGSADYFNHGNKQDFLKVAKNWTGAIQELLNEIFLFN